MRSLYIRTGAAFSPDERWTNEPSVLWRRVYRAGRNLPPVSSRERGNAEVARRGRVRVRHVRVPRRKKHRAQRRRERETERERGRGRVGSQLSAGWNFKFEHPLSIKSVPFPEGTVSMPCCSYTNFINHASQHTGGGGYPAGSPSPSYIFAHEIRSRETYRATDDWRM